MNCPIVREGNKSMARNRKFHTYSEFFTTKVAYNKSMKNGSVVSIQLHFLKEYCDQRQRNHMHQYTMPNYLHTCYCTKVHKMYKLIMLHITKRLKSQCTCIIPLHCTLTNMNVLRMMCFTT